ncbi:alpha/beta fold hydrolase [Halostella sp. PRR32]|uniref:alpha/beta fold hydrolase n=1 Tax=Halostella sp. PRR32 TaxID=3098147 RepID=UPI002B1DD18B|nr:alpha/beta fold hydrolase [Halostella sp. PRR32]
MITNEHVPAADSLYVTVDDRRLHYLRAGDSGPPLVFLHGGGVDDATVSWKHAVPYFAERYQVYALDWPGYGESDDAGVTPTTEFYTETLAGFLDAVGLDSATLVGISMGGAAALTLAVRDPARVDRLALVDSYGLSDAVPGGIGSYFLANAPFANTFGRFAFGANRAAARTALRNIVYDADAVDGEFVDDVRDRIRRPDSGEDFVAYLRHEFSPSGVRTSHETNFASVRIPTLVAHGREDPLLPVEWSEAAARSLPNGELAVFEECGHWPPRERPVQFNETLADFLARTSPQP